MQVEEKTENNLNFLTEIVKKIEIPDGGSITIAKYEGDITSEINQTCKNAQDFLSGIYWKDKNLRLTDIILHLDKTNSDINWGSAKMQINLGIKGKNAEQIKQDFLDNFYEGALEGVIREVGGKERTFKIKDPENPDLTKCSAKFIGHGFNDLNDLSIFSESTKLIFKNIISGERFSIVIEGDMESMNIAKENLKKYIEPFLPIDSNRSE